jgi:hypothetical protein
MVVSATNPFFLGRVRCKRIRPFFSSTPRRNSFTELLSYLLTQTQKSWPRPEAEWRRTASRNTQASCCQQNYQCEEHENLPDREVNFFRHSVSTSQKASEAYRAHAL